MKFCPKKFALEVRLEMARQNLSIRKAAEQIGIVHVNLHRITAKELEPSVTTYFAVRAWLDAALTGSQSHE